MFYIIIMFFFGYLMRLAGMLKYESITSKVHGDCKTSLNNHHSLTLKYAKTIFKISRFYDKAFQSCPHFYMSFLLNTSYMKPFFYP